ncbi:MAG: ImmA/IrrE family metallo-endopeptidase [Solirubrobacterales bacterium]
MPDYIWNGEELPIPVDKIVDSMFGLRVRKVQDMSQAPGAPAVSPEKISGLLLTGLGEIWVNAAEDEEWPTRGRFTIGHELGHWVLHRTGQQKLFCRTAVVGPETAGDSLGGDVSPDSTVTSRPAIPVTEEEANAFSAALLMPAHLLSEQHQGCQGDMNRLKQTFDCSHKAMSRRIGAVIYSR